MVPRPELSPRRVAVISLVVGLMLVTAPLWIGVFDLQKPISTYERVEMTTDEEAIQYAESPPGGSYPVMSESLGCTLGQPWTDRRLCELEASIANGDSRPITDWTDDPHADPRSPAHRYEYVILDGTIYEPSASVGADPGDPPADADGEYPVYLDLERVDPAVALRDLSIAVQHDSIPDVVQRAARDGSATTRGTVDAPARPIRLADGTIYRVVQSETEDPSAWYGVVHSLATYLAPLLGLLAIHAAWRRTNVRVTYREPRW